MKTLFVAVRAVTYAGGFVFLWGWIALGVRRYDESVNIIVPDWAEIPGMIAIVLGSFIVLSCLEQFVVRGEGTPAPFDAPEHLVAAGPYRVVRNPMYLGALIIVAGLGLLLRSFSIILLSSAMSVLFHLFVVLYEEPTLKRRFGEAYERYCAGVPRWIPRVKRTKN